MFRTSKGLTLIELLASILLISAMLGAIGLIYNTGYDVFYNQYARQNIKGQAALTMTVITSELHQALSITAATATGLTFTADLNSDGINETIQYDWPSAVSGNPLNRISGTETKQVIRSLSSLSLTYFGDNNAQLVFPVTPSQVRLVLIDLTATSGSEFFHLRTKVQLRCI